VSWLLPAVLLWVIWAALLFAGQRRMIFPGRRADALRDGAFPTAELHRIEVPGGAVEAWWLPAAAGAPRPAPAVIFLHGNFELVDEWMSSFEALRAAGAGVLLVEYPGYGRSTGVATQTSVSGSAVSAWDLLAAKVGEVDPTRIVALGRSVGSGPACALALERPLAALVLSSGFTGIRAYARRYLLPGFLVRHPFDNETVVRAFEGPVLVQHGTRDGTVPFQHGVRLAEAARDGELIRYQCGHNDCPWDRMLEDMIAFLNRRGVLGNAAPVKGVG
jgi:fermentation-respiration switch protein FrsA (DUF1100 family)